MEKTNVKIGRGGPVGNDGIWSSGPKDIKPEQTDCLLSAQFIQQLYRQKGAISE